MLRTIKRATAVAVVVLAGAFAPSGASANVWQADNPIVKPYSGAAHIGGTLTMTWPATGGTLTCTVTATTNLTNPGGVAAGQITIYRVGVPAGGTCTTNAPNCTISMTASALPWGLTTTGSNVSITGMHFSWIYGGGSACSWNGVAMTATGSITGSTAAGSNAITFTNAPGLTSPLGSVTMNGTVRVNVENAAGGPNTARPITLVP